MYIENEMKKSTARIEYDGWLWKMTYCKINQIPPAQGWAWERATAAYKEYLNEIFSL